MNDKVAETEKPKDIETLLIELRALIIRYVPSPEFRGTILDKFIEIVEYFEALNEG